VFEDVDKVIELEGASDIIYYLRANTNYVLENYVDAIEDYNKAIELNPKYDKSYYFRGLSKIKIGKTTEACSDLRKAADLGYEDAFEAIKMNCQK
jgi:tetratricopeptide (TPR) repeat protein